MRRILYLHDVITFSSKKAFYQWMIYLRSLLDGGSLEVSVDKANTSIAFKWRHINLM